MWKLPSASLEQGSCVPGKVPQALLQSKQQKNLQAGFLQVENAHFICKTFVGPLLKMKEFEGRFCYFSGILDCRIWLSGRKCQFWEREISFFGGKNWTPICNRISTTPLQQKSLLFTPGLVSWKAYLPERICPSIIEIASLTSESEIVNFQSHVSIFEFGFVICGLL
jgi:hypothetical protein